MTTTKLIRPVLLMLLSMLYLYAKAQVTTATISGSITGPDGKALSGATVTISYDNAGIKKTTATQSNGTFLVPNLRVGGPYKITASFTGLQEKTEDNIFLELGQNTAVDFALDS